MKYSVSDFLEYLRVALCIKDNMILKLISPMNKEVCNSDDFFATWTKLREMAAKNKKQLFLELIELNFNIALNQNIAKGKDNQFQLNKDDQTKYTPKQKQSKLLVVQDSSEHQRRSGNQGTRLVWWENRAIDNLFGNWEANMHFISNLFQRNTIDNTQWSNANYSSSNNSQGTNHREWLSQWTEMGFNERNAQIALILSFNNVSNAAGWWATNDDSYFEMMGNIQNQIVFTGSLPSGFNYVWDDREDNEDEEEDDDFE